MLDGQVVRLHQREEVLVIDCRGLIVVPTALWVFKPLAQGLVALGLRLRVSLFGAHLFGPRGRRPLSSTLVRRRVLHAVTEDLRAVLPFPILSRWILFGDLQEKVRATFEGIQVYEAPRELYVGADEVVDQLIVGDEVLVVHLEDQMDAESLQGVDVNSRVHTAALRAHVLLQQTLKGLMLLCFAVTLEFGEESLAPFGHGLAHQALEALDF